jgi:hypothetical protein
MMDNYWKPTQEDEPRNYKGLQIGDTITINQKQFDEYYSEFVTKNLVEVTGFNPPHDIVHWRGPSLYGGVVHTGCKYNDVTKLLK